jgi:hypothetical protein
MNFRLESKGSARQKVETQSLRTQASDGPAVKPDRAAYEKAHGLTVAELKDLPRAPQRQLLTTMAQLFSAEWGNEDKRYKTAERTHKELEKQLNSADPYDAIIVSFKKVSEDGKEKYELVSTASMARRDNPAFDNLYEIKDGCIKKKYGNGWLMNVFTVEDYLRKGHAAHVIGEITAIAERRKKEGALRDFNGFHLYTRPDNLAYYQKLGFSIVGREYIPGEDKKGKSFPQIPAYENDQQLIEYVMRYSAPTLHQVAPLAKRDRKKLAAIPEEACAR